jgi:hypothetical protein
MSHNSPTEGPKDEGKPNPADELEDIAKRLSGLEFYEWDGSLRGPALIRPSS